MQLQRSHYQQTSNGKLSPSSGTSISVDSNAFINSSILRKHFHNKQHDLSSLLVARRPEVRIVVDDFTVVVPRDFRHRITADFADESRLVAVHDLLRLQFPHEYWRRAFHLANRRPQTVSYYTSVSYTANYHS